MAKRQREAFWSDENVLYHRLWCSLNNSMYLLEPVKLEFKAKIQVIGKCTFSILGYRDNM